MVDNLRRGRYVICYCFYTWGWWKSIVKTQPILLKPSPLGEIDFIWKFEDGLKPRNDSYKIEIFDIVRVAGAYGSQETGVPDKNLFPDTDIAPSGGVIDIFDVVTAASKYGEEWG